MITQSHHMSIHIETALKGIVGQAVNDANNEFKYTFRRDDYRPYVAACVAAETSELRRQLAELKLANYQLAAENARLNSAKT